MTSPVLEPTENNPKGEGMTLEIIRKQRGIPFIKRGMKVFHHYNNKFGRIVSANSSGNLNIKFDNENYSVNCHPLWEMTYYSSDGNIIKTFRDSVQQTLCDANAK